MAGDNLENETVDPIAITLHYLSQFKGNKSIWRKQVEGAPVWKQDLFFFFYHLAHFCRIVISFLPLLHKTLQFCFRLDGAMKPYGTAAKNNWRTLQEKRYKTVT